MATIKGEVCDACGTYLPAEGGMRDEDERSRMSEQMSVFDADG